MMPRLLSRTGQSPRCETCGLATTKLGKLPGIGLRPLIYVYKCESCNQIMSIEPDQPTKLARPALR
jgi:hypothetical protein